MLLLVLLLVCYKPCQNCMTNGVISVEETSSSYENFDRANHQICAGLGSLSEIYETGAVLLNLTLAILAYGASHHDGGGDSDGVDAVGLFPDPSLHSCFVCCEPLFDHD